MLFGNFKERRRIRDVADSLYRTIVAQSRIPRFYATLGIPDTPDGRLDLILLHAYIVLRRLRGSEGTAKKLSQRFFDQIFEDMDQNLREMGVGDLRVGRRVKETAALFYGRIRAYDESILVDDEGLAQALARNLYRDVGTEPEKLAIMADYLRREVVAAQAWEISNILAGDIAFGAAPDQPTGKGAL